MYFANNQSHIFIFEQHNGKDKKRAIKQITNHCYCLAKGTFSDHFKIKKPSNIYYVFEFETCMKSVINEFKNNACLMAFKDYFFFKTQQQITQNFNNNWNTATNSNSTFIPTT